MKKTKAIIALAVLLFWVAYYTGLRDLSGLDDTGAMKARTIDAEQIVIPDTKLLRVSAEEAKKRLQSDTATAVLLDVRTREEHEELSIPGSILIPLEQGNFLEAVKKMIPKQDSLIFIYCRSGRRSQIATEKLREYGYKNTFDMGGIMDWPYEITRKKANKS